MSQVDQEDPRAIEAAMMEISKAVNKDRLINFLEDIGMSKTEFVVQVGEDMDKDTIVDVLLGYIDTHSIPLSEVFTGEPDSPDLEEDILDLDDEQQLNLFRKHLENMGLFEVIQ